MIIMSIHYFQFSTSGILQSKSATVIDWFRIGLRIHIAFGLIAIFTGPFQFLYSIKKKNKKIHRWLGYTYVIAVGMSGVSGLLIAQEAMGGKVASLGFSLLSIFWLIFTSLAVSKARQQRINQHRYWMYLSYALTFSAIPQRTMLLIPLFFTVDFMNIYRLSAWLPWLLNILLAILLFHSKAKKNPIHL